MKSKIESNREKRDTGGSRSPSVGAVLSDTPARGTSPHHGCCYTSAGKRDMWTLGNLFNILRFYVWFLSLAGFISDRWKSIALPLGIMKFGVPFSLRMYCVIIGRRVCVSHTPLMCKAQWLRKSCERICNRNLKRQNDINVYNLM